MTERPLTPKQEKFCQKYIELGNASEAYRQSYDCESSKPETVWNEAYKLLSNPDVYARVNELKELAVKQHLVTVESLTSEYDEVRQMALQEKQLGPAVSAITGKAKLNGLLVEKKDIKLNLLEDLPDEHVDTRIKQLLSEAGITDLAGGEGEAEA